jgi:hypothetical protein
LYTSLEREGALAEISYYWAQLTPRPSKPIVVHRLTVVATRTLNLVRTDLERFGVDMARFSERDYSRTQQIGGACAFLGYDGLMVPSARWDCENLVIFSENHGLSNDLSKLESEEVDWQAWELESEEVDWQAWARETGVIDDS